MLLVSVVIPTHNEEADIRETLEAALALDYPALEVIVVDDSTDDTPKIVQGYAGRGVRLIGQSNRRGRCGARNMGILAAGGDVVIILNADVHLPRDFVHRILVHYRNGADYVLVAAHVENLESVVARYFEAIDWSFFKDNPNIQWTEGFSCRRVAAMSVGMFPDWTKVPIVAGEDGYFGLSLYKAGYRRVIDRSIIVRHVAPSTLRDFWRQQEGRGRGAPQTRILLENNRWYQTAVIIVLKTVWWSIKGLLLLPILVDAAQLIRYSPRGISDVVYFFLLRYFQLRAHIIGEWKGLIDILRSKPIATYSDR